MRGTKAKSIRRTVKAATLISKLPTNDRREYVIGRIKSILNREGERVATHVTLVNAAFTPRSLYQRWKRGTTTMVTLRGAA